MPGKTADYLDMLLVDHGIFRVAYLNKHRLGDKAWRSAQPAPYQIRALAKQGIRTLVNLRGERECGSYRLEREACERYGVALVDFNAITSRRAPTFDDIMAVRALFDQVTYPMLMHCKSGADRTGLMSTLYCHFREGMPLAEARKHLSPLYGHWRWTGTGILDAFFARYLEDNGRAPIPFLQWVERVYDPTELTRTFRTTSRLAWPKLGKA